jgi:c-di-GMP-binding flagellar brake protein YcgR
MIGLRRGQEERVRVLVPRVTALEATVVRAVPGPQGRVREDLLHFLQAVVPLAPPRAPQRRDEIRIDLVRPVALIPEGFKVGWLNGFTRNVSAGGVLIAGADALEAGDRLRLRFELDDEDDLIDLLGRVVRADDAWGLRGLRLEQLTDRERERIVKFVFARQRRALAQLRSRTA